MMNINEIYYDSLENTVDSEEKKEVDKKLEQALIALSNLFNDAEAISEQQGFINGYKQAMNDFNANQKVEKKMIKKFVNSEDAGTAMFDEVLNVVKVDNIQNISLIPYEDDPYVSIYIEDEEGNRIDYLMRAIKAEEIVRINKLLTSFDLGITVEFINYNQYDLFIDYCMNLIKAKREVTA